MQKKTITAYPSILLFIALFFISSCNSNTEEEKKQDNATITPPKTESLTTGALDTLYIEKSAFENIQGSQPKLVFSFIFTNPDTLTLHGWLYKNPFNQQPDMKLKYFNRAVNINYGIGNYFGNVVLLPTDIARIKQALTPAMNYVLFAPKLDGNTIKYEILVTDKLRVSKDAILVVSAIGVDANPSPPKNY